MSNNNLFSRSLHDLGLGAWFGGSLMGAVGLNGAASAAKDPVERLELSSLGWGRWTPVQVAAIGAHAMGGAGLILGNRNRLALDPATQTNTRVKTAVTLAAAGLSTYAGVLGKKMHSMRHEGGAGATEPKTGASLDLATAQRQLKLVQWGIPALTGVAIVLGAQQGEQQRDSRGNVDKKSA